MLCSCAPDIPLQGEELSGCSGRGVEMERFLSWWGGVGWRVIASCVDEGYDGLGVGREGNSSIRGGSV